MAALEELRCSKDLASDGYVVRAEDGQVGIINKSEPLARDLRNRHMQMMAIGALEMPCTASTTGDLND